MGDPHLQITSLTKSFGSLKANDNVTITVERGSIHAILGENGAGKSTLMNMLYGLLQPDSGSIVVKGLPVIIDSPKTALSLGIGMVHQHFTLVGPLSVTENVILGLSGSLTGLRLAECEARLRVLSEAFGFEIDPRREVSSLPIGMQQRVEILKALYRDVDLLVLDEPTSVLTPGETTTFFAMLRRLRDAGKTVVIITHKLDEVMDLSDRVTVMRMGRVTDELETRNTDTSELARLMVGRDVVLAIDKTEARPGPVLLQMDQVVAIGERGNRALDGLSLEIHEGEILGIAGVDGNGQAELAEVIAGLRPSVGGSIRLRGQDLNGRSVAERNLKMRIGYVPEDRHRTGLVLDYSIAENLILRERDRPPFSKRGMLRFGAIRENAERLAKQYRVKADGVDQPVRRLSGGNQQKVILAREIEARPELLVVAQACKGLDVGAIEFVQSTLIAQRDKGVGILYISTELEHVIAVCDRIAVLFRGRITGYIRPSEVTPERIGKLMAGIGETAA